MVATDATAVIYIAYMGTGWVPELRKHDQWKGNASVAVCTAPGHH